MALAPLDEEARRLQAVHTAMSLRNAIASRPNRDHRVQVSIYLHVADASMDGDAVRGGDLLELDKWVPGESGEGIFGSSVLLRRLELEHTTMIAAPIRFYHIDHTL